ncbi:MAG: hypothetical protein JST00_20415 [Deltaproteobacteria bacterium]|nr:hypothetical protein [Deltaproteobacteria bacterium]
MTDPDVEDVFEYDALDRLKKVTRRAPAGGAITSVEDYAYNALGALKLNAGITLDDQRPRLSGGGTADAAVPGTLGGLPVTLDAGGFVTSLRGASLEYSRRGFLKRMTPPLPERGEFYAYDSSLRRVLRQLGDTSGSPPLRALRASGGASVGGYRYSAFGKLVEDTTTIDQPLKWKGRWYSPIAGGTYDVRARQWAPEAGVFLAIDEYEWHDSRTTLWGWPGGNPTRYPDPTGRGINAFRKCLELKSLAPRGFPEWTILCLPWLFVPDPPPEFPGCAQYSRGSAERTICCVATCRYDPTDPTGMCPDYRSPPPDANAQRCFERCMDELKPL